MVLSWCELYRVLDALQRRVDLESLSNRSNSGHVFAVVGEVVGPQAVARQEMATLTSIELYAHTPLRMMRSPSPYSMSSLSLRRDVDGH